MRSPDEITNKLDQIPELHVERILTFGLEQDVDKLTSHLTTAYDKAFVKAVKHQPTLKDVDKFATFAWLAGCDLDVNTLGWFNFGMPRIKALAKILNLPWPLYNVDNQTREKIKRMSNGLPCNELCIRCHTQPGLRQDACGNSLRDEFNC